MKINIYLKKVNHIYLYAKFFTFLEILESGLTFSNWLTNMFLTKNE